MTQERHEFLWRGRGDELRNSENAQQLHMQSEPIYCPVRSDYNPQLPDWSGPKTATHLLHWLASCDLADRFLPPSLWRCMSVNWLVVHSTFHNVRPSTTRAASPGVAVQAPAVLTTRRLLSESSYETRIHPAAMGSTIDQCVGSAKF